jgi:hypothetical protein
VPGCFVLCAVCCVLCAVCCVFRVLVSSPSRWPTGWDDAVGGTGRIDAGSPGTRQGLRWLMRGWALRRLEAGRPAKIPLDTSPISADSPSGYTERN